MKHSLNALVVYLGFATSFVLSAIPFLQFVCLFATVIYTFLQIFYILKKNFNDKTNN